MRLNKIIYTKTKKRNTSFKDMHLTRSDITFPINDQYATLWLNRSKTNTYPIGDLIIFAAIISLSYFVNTLLALCIYNL